MSFGEVFHDCIEEKGIPFIQFSRDTGLNRGLVHNIWKGNKRLPEHTLQELFRNKVFLPEQEERLREAYYAEVYGTEAFERLRFIQSALRRHAQLMPPSPMFGHLGSYAPTLSREIVTSESALLAVLYFVLRTELDNSDTPWLESNYPFAATEVDDFTYAMLGQYKHKKPQFYHSVTFEASGKTTLNLRNLFSAVRYFQLRHNVYGTISEQGDYLPPDALYPCYFISSRHVLLFHPEKNNGLLLSEPEIVQTIALSAAQQHTLHTAMAQFSTDEMDVQQVFSQQAAAQQALGEFSALPCLGAFTDRGMLDEILCPDIPARNAFIDMLYSLYQRLRGDSPAPHFHTMRGFEEFVRTGKFQEMSSRIATPAPPKMRGELLRRICSAIQAGAQILLLDDRALPFPNGLGLEYFNNCLLVAGSISEGENAYMGEFFHVADRQTTTQDFNNFMGYILRNQFHLSMEQTLNYLGDLAARCEDE